MSAIASELTILKKAALRSYRHLLKTQKSVFSNDHKTLSEARNKCRMEFESNKCINDPKLLKEKIDEAEQVRQFLEKNIVQGVLFSSNSTQSISKNIKVKIDERLEMWDYSKNGRPTCGCC